MKTKEEILAALAQIHHYNEERSKKVRGINAEYKTIVFPIMDSLETVRKLYERKTLEFIDKAGIKVYSSSGSGKEIQPTVCAVTSRGMQVTWEEYNPSRDSYEEISEMFVPWENLL
jgi:hypothetical protein